MKTALLRELPEQERPREKLLQKGPKFLSNQELLALLLRTGTNDLSVVDLAGKVLALSQDGLRYLAECTPEELMTVPGIGDAKACQIVSAIELGKRIAMTPNPVRKTARSTDELAGLFMEEMRCLKQEVFRVLLLNTRMEILSMSDVSVGNIMAVAAEPREVFRDAVRKAASAIIVVHNHPSGSPEPSKNDVRVTRRLEETGSVLGIPLCDHLIIGDGVYYSFAEHNRLRKE